MMALSLSNPANLNPARAEQSPAVLFIGWTGALLLYLFIDVTSGIRFFDDAWFLQVVHRVMSGEILYRDVFFNVTPLSLDLALLYATIFGTEILAIKCLMASIYLATAMVSARLLRQISSSREHPLFLALAILALAPPWRLSTPYSGMAELFLLCCFSLSLAGLHGAGRDAKAAGKATGGSFRLLLAGAAAACAFMSKQNIGVCTLTAACAGEVMVSWDVERKWRRVSHSILLILLSFSLVAVPVVVPILLGGGWRQFVDYGFTNKTAYLALARIGYREAFSGIMNAGFSLPYVINFVLLYLLPPVTIGGLLLSLPGRPEKARMTMLVLVYVVATVVGAYPRFTPPHLAYIVPCLLIGILYSWRIVRLSLRETCAVFLQRSMLLLVAGLTSMELAKAVRLTLSENHHMADLPHFRGVLVKQSDRDRLRQVAAAMAEDAGGGQRLFLLSPRAGLFYLLSGVRNPTPFDYPAATSMGRRGEEKVIEDAGKRRIDRVWVDEQMMTIGRLRPMKLLAHISGNLEPCGRVGTFTVYHTAGSSMSGKKQ